MANETDIQTVMGMVNLSWDDSAILLEANNRDVEKALNEYFEDPTVVERYKTQRAEENQWNEEFFASDRDGNGSSSYKIHGADVGPTRPNSRLANRSPNHGGSNDGAAGALWEQYYDADGKANTPSAADPSSNWNFQQNADPEMDQALRNSLLDAGLGAQQSGVLQLNAAGAFDLNPAQQASVGEVQFGPANRTEYDKSEWAMVPIGSIRTAEVFNDPEPADRRREEGLPAFLRPATDDSRLGALLTIFHEIPLLRKLLLRTDHTAIDYGYDYEWWSSGKIEVPKLVVTSDLEGNEMEGVSQSHDLTEELQRIMAFLDKTERSYGSVENVMRVVTENNPDNKDPIMAFLEVWQETWSEDARERFLSVAFQPLVAPKPEEFMFLPVADSMVEESEDLYDCLDSALWSAPWPEGGMEPEQTPYLGRVGEVVCFKLRGKSKTNSIEIPTVWYADRFLADYREAAFETKKGKQEIKQKITKIDYWIDKLTTFTTKEGKTYKVRELFEACMRHDDRRLPLPDDHLRPESDRKVKGHPPEKQAWLDNLTKQLREQMERIDLKLVNLKKEKEKIRASLEELSEIDALHVGKEHKYTLRGISTTSSTTYINRIESPDNATEPGKEQWWKISFNAQDSNPFSVYKVDEHIVAEAARESVEPVIVYASEKAMQPCLAVLSDELSEFVEKDNEAFRAELPLKSMPEESQFDSWTSVPQSPGKRKYNEDGEEAQDVYRASPGRRGSMDVNFEGSDDENTPRRGSVSENFPPPAKEMVERSKQPLAMLGAASKTNKSTDDLTDFDQVMQDAEAAEESAAVKELGG